LTTYELVKAQANLMKRRGGTHLGKGGRKRLQEECEAVKRRQWLLLEDLTPRTVAPINPAWLTPNVKAIAQAVYDERRFQDLPILGDALEEAGCTNADLLGHCRSGGEHVKGCWAVDLVLGKE